MGLRPAARPPRIHPDLDPLDGRDRHDGGGEECVEAAVVMDVEPIPGNPKPRTSNTPPSVSRWSLASSIAAIIAASAVGSRQRTGLSSIRS